MKKLLTKLSAIAMAATLATLPAAAETSTPATADTASGEGGVIGAFTLAGSMLVDGFKEIMNSVVLPIAYVVEIGVLLFALMGFIKKRRGGEDFGQEITTLAIVIAVLLLTATFNTWTAGLW